MLTKSISTKNAKHYIWNEGCEGWHLLETEELSVIEETMLPNTSESMHYHENAKQLFYILEGVATMQLENETIILSQGDSFYLPKQKPHKISNHSDNELRFLVISSPKSHGDRVSCDT